MQEKNQSLDQHAQRLKAAMQQLPFVSADLPGVGGAIKKVPEHFQVEEILPYTPCGEGEHVFVTLRRKGWNTADVAAELAGPLGLKRRDVGWAGRKDKQAVTTQTFSLLIPLDMALADVSVRLAGLPFEILDLKRHRHKLKTGHVAANRFRILLSQVAPESFVQAETIASALRQRGVPNFYGEQRFGIQRANLDRAFSILEHHRPVRGKRDAFIVSAFQSALFNLWLTERIARHQYHTMILGDVAQKTDTGGLFVVQDMDDALLRFSQGKIAYTGPIFGPKMKAAAEQAAEYENQVLKAFDLDVDLFKRLKAPGSRRRAVLSMDDLRLSPVDEGLVFEFILPPGAYATTVMREFLRPPA